MSRLRESLKAALRAMDDERRVDEEAKQLTPETIGGLIKAKQETISALTVYKARLEKEQANGS